MRALKLSFIGLLLIGCGNQYDENKQPANELEAINLIRKSHVNAVNTTNVELLLKDMSSDILYLAPGIDPIEGKEALREFITPIYEVITPNIEMIPTDIEIYDNIAIEWGLINGKLSQKGIDSIQSIKSKYLFVYKKSKTGKWMITKDIYNDINE